MEKSFATENERLKHLMEVLNFSNQTDFAASLGMKQGSLSDVLRGKNGVGVSDSIKWRLFKDHSINIDWLETGSGEISLSKEQPSVVSEPAEEYLRLNERDVITLPVSVYNKMIEDIKTNAVYAFQLEESKKRIRELEDDLKKQVSPAVKRAS